MFQDPIFHHHIDADGKPLQLKGRPWHVDLLFNLLLPMGLDEIPLQLFGETQARFHTNGDEFWCQDTAGRSFFVLKALDNKKDAFNQLASEGRVILTDHSVSVMEREVDPHFNNLYSKFYMEQGLLTLCNRFVRRDLHRSSDFRAQAKTQLKPFERTLRGFSAGQDSDEDISEGMADSICAATINASMVLPEDRGVDLLKLVLPLAEKYPLALTQLAIRLADVYREIGNLKEAKNMPERADDGKGIRV